MLNDKILKIIQSFTETDISADRKMVLQPLIDYIRKKKEASATIRLNFICTHNSRRSHLSQVWAQTMAFHFGVEKVVCYSGGTEATAMFYKVVETLQTQGFDIKALSDATNPVYAVKYNPIELPLICFSKTYDDSFNPASDFAAIMTCSSADAGCPVVIGAEARVPVTYDDPKAFDGTDLMDAKYAERSIQIAREMWYVFKEVSE